MMAAIGTARLTKINLITLLIRSSRAEKSQSAPVQGTSPAPEDELEVVFELVVEDGADDDRVEGVGDGDGDGFKIIGDWDEGVGAFETGAVGENTGPELTYPPYPTP